MLTAGSLVARRNIKYSVRIDEESDLNSRQACRLLVKRPQLEPRQAAAVPGQLPFALKYVNIDVGLIVYRRGKPIDRAGGDRSVPMYQPFHHAAHGLDTEREWDDVEQQHVALRPHQDTRLHRRPQGHDLVGIE